MKSPNPCAIRASAPRPSLARLLAAPALLLALALPSASGDVFLMGKELAVNPTGGWQSYVGKDSPPAGYLGWLLPGTNSITTTVNFGQTLPPGDYVLSLKVGNYDANGRITITAGGVTAEQSCNDRDYNGTWLVPVPFRFQTPASSVSLVFHRSLVPSTTQKYMFNGVYVSSDTNNIVLKSDRVVRLSYPKPSDFDDSAPIPGNLFPNPSFEAGLGSGWGFEGSPRSIAIRTVWSTDDAFHGRGSLKIDLPGRRIHTLQRIPFRVRPNRTHTVSLYVKSLESLGLTMRLENTFDPPAGFPPQQSINKRFIIGNAWTRVSISDRLLRYPESEFILQLELESIVNTTVWIDAVQLEEGGLSPFAESSPLEVGFLPTPDANNIFFDDQPISIPVGVANRSPLARSTTLEVGVFDWKNTPVLTTNLLVSVVPDGDFVYNVPIPSGRRGAFRLTAALRQPASSQDECVIGVIPRGQPGIDAEVSHVGIHANFTAWQARLLKKMGIHWIRAMSPGPYFRWIEAEPSPGTFSWYDEDIDVVRQEGLSILGTISQTPPEWAHRTYFTITNVVGPGFVVSEPVRAQNGALGNVSFVLQSTNFTGSALQLIFAAGVFANGDTIQGVQSGTTAKISSAAYPKSIALDRWEPYVSNLVSHYKGKVAAWEIGNEPDKATTSIPLPGANPGFYTEMLRMAVRQVSTIDPTSKIIAMGGAFATNWFDQIASKLTPDEMARIHAFSTHLYPGNEDLAAAHHNLASGKYGKTAWNTETAAWDLGFYTGVGSNERYEGTPLQPFRDSERYYRAHTFEACSMLRNFLVSVGSGLTQYFYYDARQAATAINFATTPSILEYDDTIRVKGIAYSIAASLVNGSTAAGRVPYTDSRLRAYVFSTLQGSSFAAVFSTGDPIVQFSIPFSASLQSAVSQTLDTMGNPFTPSGPNLSVDGAPIYLTSQLTAPQLLAALSSVTPQLSTDTEPPRVAITRVPSETPNPDSSILLRWLAIDNLSVPSVNQYHALLYTYRLVGRDTEWSPWTPSTSLQLANLPLGQYELQVQAKDDAGNLSSIASYPFWVATPPATPTGVLVGN